MRILFSVIIGICFIIPVSTAMEYRKSVRFTSQDWAYRYLGYFKDAEEKKLLLHYLANRMHLNNLYYEYLERQSQARKEKDGEPKKIPAIGSELKKNREKNAFLHNYFQHYNFYRECEAALEICAITSGYPIEKNAAYNDLNYLVPAPPEFPYDNVLFKPTVTAQFTRNAQKLIDTLAIQGS